MPYRRRAPSPGPINGGGGLCDLPCLVIPLLRPLSLRRLGPAEALSGPPTGSSSSVGSSPWGPASNTPAPGCPGSASGSWGALPPASAIEATTPEGSDGEFASDEPTAIRLQHRLVERAATRALRRLISLRRDGRGKQRPGGRRKCLKEERGKGRPVASTRSAKNRNCQNERRIAKEGEGGELIRD